jgi:chaperonin cofactor prefoldin
MIAKRDQFYEKKFNELLQHVGQPQQRQMPDPKQLLRAMGYEIPEEQPQFASIPDVQRYVQEQLGQFQQQTQQAMYVRHEYDDARADLQQLKSQYPQYFEGELASQVEATLGHLWGSQDDLPMREVGKTFFALLERAADARNASYARTKANDGRAVPIRQVGSGVQVTAGKQIDLATEGGIDEAMDALLAQQAG